MYDVLIKQMKDEVTRLGVQELTTVADVDATLPTSKGTMLVVVNSTCGCAGGIARPALSLSLQHTVKPDKLVTVFASTDREATARAREYFGADVPPSSPSFALFKDGKFVDMIHRHQIEGRTPGIVAKMLTDIYEKHGTR